MGKQPSGFGEEQQSVLSGLVAHSGNSHDSEGARLKIGPGGRVVIPADVRHAMNVVEGDTLLATLSNGELRLVSTQTALSRARALVRASIPADVSLVDELFAERRREVERDEKRGR